MRVRWWVLLGTLSVAACSSSSFDIAAPPLDAADDAADDVAVDAGSDVVVSDTSAPPDVAEDVVVDSAAPLDVRADEGPTCAVSTYDPKSLDPGGYVCGFGMCRVVLDEKCRPKLSDGGVGSPCAAHFGPEKGGNGADDNCNGVVDEGDPSPAPNAGFECVGCAWGRKVQRKADGTLDTVNAGNVWSDYSNNPGCINSDLCKLPGAQWVRHAGLGGAKSCVDFCKNLGRTCTPSCSTVGTGCKPAAQKESIGTFAADYACMGGTVPLVGDCSATLPSVTPSAAFNVYCCCGM